MRATPLVSQALPLDKKVVERVIQLLHYNVPVSEILAANGRFIKEHFDGHVTTSYSRVLLTHTVCFRYSRIPSR